MSSNRDNVETFSSALDFNDLLLQTFVKDRIQFNVKQFQSNFFSKCFKIFSSILSSNFEKLLKVFNSLFLFITIIKQK